MRIADRRYRHALSTHPPKLSHVRGEIVDMTLFDLGAEVDLDRVVTLLGQRPRRARLVSRHPAPPSLALPEPIVVRADPARFGADPAGTRVEVRLHALGVLAIRVRMPCEAPALADLHLRTAGPRDGGRTTAEAMAGLREEVAAEVRHALLDPYQVVVSPEVYTVVVLTEGHPSPQRLLREDPRPLAGVLLGEPRADRLAPGMVEDALRRTVQYTQDDLVAVGWDYAVVVERAGEYEDLLDVLELANLELLELRTLDAILDQRLDASIHALERLWARGGLFRSARSLLEDISILRADFTRIKDSVYDTGKVYGDWYLAKVHQRLRDRFHLREWERAVEHKMHNLEGTFQLAEEEANHRRATLLEALIVLLFIVDLAAIFLLPH